GQLALERGQLRPEQLDRALAIEPMATDARGDAERDADEDRDDHADREEADRGRDAGGAADHARHLRGGRHVATDRLAAAMAQTAPDMARTACAPATPARPGRGQIAEASLDKLLLAIHHTRPRLASSTTSRLAVALLANSASLRRRSRLRA